MLYLLSGLIFILAVYFSVKYGLQQTIDFIKARGLGGLLIFLVFLTCIKDNTIDKLSYDNRRLTSNNNGLQTETENLKAQLALAERNNTDLIQIEKSKAVIAIAERDSLNKLLEVYLTTDEGLWKAALDLEDAGNLESAYPYYQKIVAWHPGSQFTAAASKKIDDAKASIRQRFKELKKGLSVTNANAALQKIDDFSLQAEFDSLTYTQCQELHADYAKLAVIEENRNRIAKKFGVEIVEIKSYWRLIATTESAILAPCIKLKIKNVGDKSLESLWLLTSFDDIAKKEQFGNCKTSIVSSMDSPLKVGFSKEALIKSDTGINMIGMLLGNLALTEILAYPEKAKEKLPELQANIYIDPLGFSSENELLLSLDIDKKVMPGLN